MSLQQFGLAVLDRLSLTDAVDAWSFVDCRSQILVRTPLNLTAKAASSPNPLNTQVWEKSGPTGWPFWCLSTENVFVPLLALPNPAPQACNF